MYVLQELFLPAKKVIVEFVCELWMLRDEGPGFNKFVQFKMTELKLRDASKILVGIIRIQLLAELVSLACT